MLAAVFMGGQDIFWLISLTTWAKDFKFAGAIVQRLLLVMVALTKKWLSAQ